MTSIDIAGNGNLRIHVPMTLKRKAGRKLVLAPEALDGAVPGATGRFRTPWSRQLPRLTNGRRCWNQARLRDVSVLARKVSFSAYTVRILSLVNLSPDIVEAIVYGREPDGLSLAKIFEGFPDDWEEQRKVLGFEKR